MRCGGSNQSSATGPDANITRRLTMTFGFARCRHRYRFLFAGHVIGRQLFAICRHSTMKGRDGRRRRRKTGRNGGGGSSRASFSYDSNLQRHPCRQNLSFSMGFCRASGPPPQSTRCHLPNVEIYGGAKRDWHSTDLGDNPLDFRRNVIWH